MKINEIYRCKVNKSINMSSLERWYNEVIQKDITKIGISDVLRMFRQNLFIEVAVKRAIEMLKQNPMLGEMYDGELLEKICSEKIMKYLNEYKLDIADIIEKAEKRLIEYNWLIDKEKLEYCNYLKKIKKFVYDNS